MGRPHGKGKKISELKKEGNRMTIKKELQALNKDIKALSKKVDGLLKTVEKSEAAKPKPAKSEPAKRAPAKKKTAGVTATEQVLRIINKRTKKGVDADTIMAKTGFNRKKVWAIVLRAYKAGKIKRVGKGLYVGK